MVIRLVIDIIYITQAYNAITFLLQFDLTGAFNQVDWIQLIYIFRELGYKQQLIRQLQSYFKDKTARLYFNKVILEPYRITQSILQSSPLSPILFIIFISTLYQYLKEIPNLIIIGFINNINLLTYIYNIKTVYETLEKGYKVYKEWVKKRGMEFNLSKSKLIYFTRIRRIYTNILNILRKGNLNLVLVKSTCFLNV